MPREDHTIFHGEPTDADRMSYVPRTDVGWEDTDPRTVQQALDRISEGRCGPVLIIAGDPVSPAIGQVWLDTDKTGSPGTAVKTVNRVTSDLTLTTSHEVLLCDATDGNIILTMPPTAANQGRAYEIKKIDSTKNTVTIIGDGADTVENATKAALKRKGQAVEPRAEGTNWHIF